MLADVDDVASALGLSSAEALTTGQQARVTALLERVSDEFQRVTGRLFTTGTTVVRGNVINGVVRLPGLVQDVNAVATTDGDPVDFTDIGGGCVSVSVTGCPLPSGVQVVVSYTGGGVPAAVTALVADVVARHLTVEPGEGKAVSMTAGPFTQRYADWVTSGALFTPAEMESVLTYRSSVPTVVIQRA